MENNRRQELEAAALAPQFPAGPGQHGKACLRQNRDRNQTIGNQKPQILKKKKQPWELLPQNWAKARAAMLPGAFVWVAFFETARAGEARSGPGLVAIAGALPPPCGTSFRTPCATPASFPGGLAVEEDPRFKERVPGGLGCPRGLLASSQGPEGDLGSGALSAKKLESQGPEGRTSSGQELVSQEVVGRGLDSELCGLEFQAAWAALWASWPSPRVLRETLTLALCGLEPQDPQRVNAVRSQGCANFPETAARGTSFGRTRTCALL